MNVVAPADAMLKARPWKVPGDFLPPEGAASLIEQVVAEAGIDARTFETASADASQNGSDVGDELVSQGVDAETLARAVAHVTALPFAVPSADERVVWRSAERDPRILRTLTSALQARIYVAPRLDALGRTMRWISQNGSDAIVVTSRDALRAHAARASATERLRAARFALSTERPEWSARTVMTAPQGYGFGIATCLVLAAFALFGWLTATALHAAISLLFLAVTGFRLLVLLDHYGHRKRAAAARTEEENALALPTRPLPVYTVLVALRHEERMVGPLVEALWKLNWPRSRLDVKLVCEADDPATLAAAERAIAGRGCFEINVVEPAFPRTKPKALNHALPVARGDYVVLYDAEDRPDPDQLLEAWLAFERGGPDLACVQAPLVIRNARQNWLTAMFALEYAVLFRAVLPFLARKGLPIPLGGTSNHFRRSALDHVGAWDSHNVAEDADLGIRLARQGYRIGVVAAPTSEIAPAHWPDWRNQRARWVKGWIQTYLVHMRQPLAALRQLGAVRMLAFQMLFLSMVAGALMHTAFVAYLGSIVLSVAIHGEAPFGLGWLMAVDILNIASAAMVFALLAAAVATDGERPMVRKSWTLWAYWILVSVASLRGIRKLFSDPHGWEKTPHVEIACSEARSDMN